MHKPLPNPYTFMPGSHVFHLEPPGLGPQTLIIPDSVRGTTTFYTTSAHPWTITSGLLSTVQINLTNTHGKYMTTVVASAGKSVTLTPEVIPDFGPNPGSLSDLYKHMHLTKEQQSQLSTPYAQKLQIHTDFPLTSGGFNHRIDAFGWVPPGWSEVDWEPPNNWPTPTHWA